MGDEGDRFRRILVGIDGSPSAARATSVAAGLARRYGAELFLLHVVPPPSYVIASSMDSYVPPISLEEYYAHARRVAERWLEEAASIAEREGIAATREVLSGSSSVAQELARYAEEKGIDLIVVGTRGMRGFKRLLLGSVASGVASQAGCSVLVVR